MNDNDLIRRGDADSFALSLATDILQVVCAKKEPNIIQLKAQIQVLISDAINAIPAVSGEPVAWASKDLTLVTTVKAIDGSMRNKSCGYGDEGVPLYTTPQDQSARIAELKAQLARYERLKKDAELGKLVRSKMISGNSIPVSRCTITHDEIEAIDSEVNNE